MLLACLVAIVPGSAFAQSVVCDGKIIRAGTSKAEVSARCGQPAQVDHKTRSEFGAVGRRGAVSGGSEDTVIEVWTYNFGPRKLMQRIWMEDGLVVRIESLGYGFN